MLRAGTDAGAPNYAVLVSPGAGIKVQVRATPGGATKKLANPTGTRPRLPQSRPRREHLHRLHVG
jgi:hypothetical protein